MRDLQKQADVQEEQNDEANHSDEEHAEESVEQVEESRHNDEDKQKDDPEEISESTGNQVTEVSLYNNIHQTALTP